MAVKLTSGRMIGLAVLVILVGEEAIFNPIRFHGTAQAGGLTMDVPVLWAAAKNPGGGVAIALRREYALSGAVAVSDRIAAGAKDGPWTEGGARREQAVVLQGQGNNPDFKNARTFDLSAGKYTAACEEAAVKGALALVCFVVGTPLELSYIGSARYEPDARKMLASLR
jgi:hypothetical protein